jgi:hypothetical protein
MKSSVGVLAKNIAVLTMAFGRAQANFWRFLAKSNFRVDAQRRRLPQCLGAVCDGSIFLMQCMAYRFRKFNRMRWWPRCAGLSLRVIAFARGQHPQMLGQPGADFGENLSSVVERPRCGLRCDRNSSLTRRRGQHSHLPHEILAGK